MRFLEFVDVSGVRYCIPDRKIHCVRDYPGSDNERMKCVLQYGEAYIDYLELAESYDVVMKKLRKEEDE